jgi:hypothetical protein
MGRVREEIFWLVMVLLSVLLGVVAFVDTTTPGSSTDNPHPWIQLFESQVCPAYKLNPYGKEMVTNCHRFSQAMDARRE